MIRLDQALVVQGLAPSRSRAAQLIAAGVVQVNGASVAKPSVKVAEDAAITLTHNPIPWVSRAALKLDHALDEFGLVPQGVCLDLGASTGGFTQVLLARGAAQVFAVDVGRDQLHPDVAGDARVVRLDGVNAKDITADLLPPLDWIVTDVSFISLEKALPPALALAKPGARLVALVKPQFEVGRAHIGKGGIVSDPVARDAARTRIEGFLADQGWQVQGTTQSPITGSDGNVEYLMTAVRARH
ncbi:23S rRNA (cytidine1920-2'-O)/16S rRNA (cytidine1409-2'-O)-methyltransferase [Monaibacterium marinum]|uniref:23S rRNA (Cytidine1920-2'-O)/16S rRNA (Cytidine1409-2'-O)-methyltransferase n=1 Tax=Pontivivens marinum TaxID=1690039 RepID=A0A2C9CN05_9RHOB|nr:TlyA family RNA methyltransferase [Monaibacterium marinum]SOH92776.1 23S rRNA (cytidine1920-2'-O)/16S rRNA (cytidine1409-2'-O)-methyltransferase [Monaibacterium marinum]